MDLLEILRNSRKRNISIIHGMLYSFRSNRPNIYTCVGETRRLPTVMDIELFAYDPYPQFIYPVSGSWGFLRQRTGV